MSWTQPSDIAGVVFIDANRNGIRDSGEPGLANVVISNQDTVVATDASGRYRLPKRADGVLFVSVPDGYRAVGAFWRPIDEAASTADVPLAPVAASADFTFIHASDTHVSPAVLARMERFRALADALDPAFVLPKSTAACRRPRLSCWEEITNADETGRAVHV